MKTNMLASARLLSDDDLLDRLAVLAGNERHASVELIAHLAALQERPSLYEGLGFGSLFEYCTAVLHLSEDATCTRTAVAGACRRFPVILDLLATGATNLTNIRRLAGKLTPENHEGILARAVHKTREEIEVLVRELDPLPDLRSSVRKVPAPAGAASTPSTPAPVPSQGSMSLPPPEGAAVVASARPLPRPVVQPSAPQRYHVKFTIGEETHRKLRRVQTLLRRWVRDWRRQAKGDVIVVRYADDFIVGFQYEWEARRFWDELRERLAAFGLKLHPEKTRLIEFGAFAESNRKRNGRGKPETFDFLGFTHVCGKTRRGHFIVLRLTMRKRLRAKLREINTKLRQRWHDPIPESGRWLASVIRGHTNYYGVPLNSQRLHAFRHQVVCLWKRALSRRSQKAYVTWERMLRIARRWLPPVRIVHPYPEQRFHLLT